RGITQGDLFLKRDGAQSELCLEKYPVILDYLEGRLQMESGHGENISVIKDAWLPSDVNLKITTEVKDKNVDLKEVDFMQTWELRWNMQLINGIFNDRDKNLILNIPLSLRNTTNSLYWVKDEKGIYYVRSAYRLLNSLHPLNQEHLEHKVWRKL
ncbi:conserved hypothetical protein, partial [Ricinus communis]